MTSIVLVFAYVVHFLCSPSKLTFNQVFSDVRLFIFLSLILAFLTPVLQSLTVSSSDDTIILFVSIFSFFHLLLYDYTSVSKFGIKPKDSKYTLINKLQMKLSCQQLSMKLQPVMFLNKVHQPVSMQYSLPQFSWRAVWLVLAQCSSYCSKVCSSLVSDLISGASCAITARRFMKCLL